MFEPGFLPIIQTSFLKHHNLLQTLESYLDNDVKQFLLRSADLDLEAYKSFVQDLEVLFEHLEFRYVLHHYVECLDFCHAEGIHLTQKSIPLKTVRDALGPKPTLGYSAHSLEEALKAEDDGADYIFLGAIFETPKSHTNHPVLGLKTLKDVCQKLTIPVFAIGGINTQNLDKVQDAGAYGFSAIRPVYKDSSLDHNIAKMQWHWKT